MTSPRVGCGPTCMGVLLWCGPVVYSYGCTPIGVVLHAPYGVALWVSSYGVALWVWSYGLVWPYGCGPMVCSYRCGPMGVLL